MTTTATTEATALPWVVLNCHCTHILGEYATELEAETAAATGEPHGAPGPAMSPIPSTISTNERHTR